MRMTLSDYINKVLAELSPFLHKGQSIFFKVPIAYSDQGNIVVVKDGLPIEFKIDLT